MGESASTHLTERFSLGTVELPIRYTDGSALACLYRVDLAAARAVMSTDCFEPLPVAGHAMAQLVALQHRETSMGAYNELGVLVLARRPGSLPSTVRTIVSPTSVEDAGWFVVNLPVTTGFACAASRELWGLPGYVTRLDTEFGREETQVILGDELVIEHRARFGVRLPAPSYVYFSELDGRLLRTVVPTEHTLRMGGARSVQVQVTGDGPTADTVRRLGLESRRPMIAARADQVKLTLAPGHPIGTVPLNIDGRRA
jgi:hypothetical protein